MYDIPHIPKQTMSVRNIVLINSSVLLYYYQFDLQINLLTLKERTEVKRDMMF